MFISVENKVSSDKLDTLFAMASLYLSNSEIKKYNLERNNFEGGTCENIIFPERHITMSGEIKYLIACYGQNLGENSVLRTYYSSCGWEKSNINGDPAFLPKYFKIKLINKIKQNYFFSGKKGKLLKEIISDINKSEEIKKVG